jgi:heterodisulfide reductase subunit C/nitrate reductase gamma subunit
MLQSLAFILVLTVVSYFAWRGFGRIIRNIRLGKSEPITGDAGARWRNVLLVAFGQRKMFKNWIPAVLHLFIYVAFLATQVELIEILIDGIFGVHRFFANKLGTLYTFMIGSIEILSVLALIATIAFILRRNILSVKRFQKPELKGWPSRDANLILIAEILLITGIFSMNGADTVLQGIDPSHYPSTGTLPVSSWLGPVLFGDMSQSSLVAIERFGWWLHAFVVFGFILYLPFSKHLHIFMAFPNTYYAKLNAKGEMENMPEITKEVRIMMGLDQADQSAPAPEISQFGANDVFSLSQKNLMDAYTCTECGRCTDACPANITGKKLSPRKVMMDVRDRMEEIGKNLDSGSQKRETYDDGLSLFNRIHPEELHACTTCNACVEACPVLINPLDIILKMRRYEILTASSGPAEWMPLFNAIENAGAAWQMSEARDAWND